jgi:hypothetical protein
LCVSLFKVGQGLVGFHELQTSGAAKHQRLAIDWIRFEHAVEKRFGSLWSMVTIVSICQGQDNFTVVGIDIGEIKQVRLRLAKIALGDNDPALAIHLTPGPTERGCLD